MFWQKAFEKALFMVFTLAVVSACNNGGGSSAPVPAPQPAAVAPTITAQPTDVTVMAGASASFSVVISGGTAPISYQWKRNGVAIGGATSATYAIATTTVADSGAMFNVDITNPAGVLASSNATLTVTAPMSPTITTQPADVSVNVGQAATFTVTISGGTAPISYQWKRNGSVIAGATTTSYQIAATVASDNGAQFNVDITNPAGVLTSATATLNVSTMLKSWGAAKQISSGSFITDPGFAQAAMDSAGNILSIWRENTSGPSPRVAIWSSRYTTSTDWSTPVTIDNPVGNSAYPHFAMSPTGVAVAAFTQGSLASGGVGNMLATRFDGTWSATEFLETYDLTNADDPRVAMAPDGSAKVVFEQSDGTLPRVWANQQGATGGAWGSAFNVDTAGPSFWPQVATGSNGESVMTYVQHTGSFTRALWASRNLGAGWSVPVLISSDTMPMASPMYPVMDGSGNALAVWSQNTATFNEVRANYLNASTGVWGSPVTLNDKTRHALEPSATVDAAGNIMVVWYEINSGIWFNRYIAASSSWSGPARVQPSGAPVGSNAHVAGDSAGNAVAIWQQVTPSHGARYELWASHYQSSTNTWGTPLKIMTNPDGYALAGSDYYHRVAMNADGKAVVVWLERVETPAALGIWARIYQ